jgi:APA family basic amino acid/polyamine antiporter
VGSELIEKDAAWASQLSAEQRGQISRLKGDGHKWGALSLIGVKRYLKPVDDSVRSPFFPYGLSGVMVGAALVFFAYIGFDSISTHAEEAIRPQRDVPLAILGSLALCTVLYMLVAAVITGMVPYPRIDREAAVATAFADLGEQYHSPMLRAATALIAAGALAGMTSVLLVTFLSQARIFLAMARDGLLPRSIFGAVHPRFKTPHRSTILTGTIIAIVAGFGSTRILEEMVSIGTLMAFALVCASVLMLRITRPQLERPFVCPAVFVVAPFGMLINLAMMLFLPLDTWLRLVIWLAVGLAIYFIYGARHSTLRAKSHAAV